MIVYDFYRHFWREMGWLGHATVFMLLLFSLPIVALSFVVIYLVEVFFKDDDDD